MGRIVLVTGGARSGKSIYGEKILAEICDKPAYVATAIAFDDEMKDRICKHQNSRPSEWTTFERYSDVDRAISEIKVDHDGYILDCVTIMVSNMMFMEREINWDKPSQEDINKIQMEILEYANRIIDETRSAGINAVIITNETGMGIVPENPISRAFRDIAGKVNQLLASKADEVYFAVSGIPMKIK